MEQNNANISEENTQSGKLRDDHFGYESNDERLEKRGMEDWNLVEKNS